MSYFFSIDLRIFNNIKMDVDFNPKPMSLGVIKIDVCMIL
jgi:hypothetical protein